MRCWTHDELHALTDNSPSLKAKSEAAHAIPRASSEEKEQGKLLMMEIYAEAVNCKQLGVAQEYVRKVFICLRSGYSLTSLPAAYASRKLCHSPAGNDYVCFCDEASSRWVRFYGNIVNEDEAGITLADTEGSGAIIRHKNGDYRKDKDGNPEVRMGAYAEFLKYPKGCDPKNHPKK